MKALCNVYCAERVQMGHVETDTRTCIATCILNVSTVGSAVRLFMRDLIQLVTGHKQSPLTVTSMYQ